MINGPASSETTTAYSRALGLVDEFGTQDQRFEILYGLFSGYHFASKFNQAREPAEKALELSRLLNDPGYSCQAHRMLGYLSFFEGNLDDALVHFRNIANLYDPTYYAKHCVKYGVDSLIASQGFEAAVHAVQGRPKTARKLAEFNIERGRSLKHPPTLGWAYASGGYLNYFLADPSRVLFTLKRVPRTAKPTTSPCGESIAASSRRGRKDERKVLALRPS